MTRPPALRLLLALTLASAVCGSVCAQAVKSISVIVLDGKTGKPVIPSNFIVRIDHLNANHNDWIAVHDDGLGVITLPANAAFFSVQATYNGSMETYVNCDAAMEKDVHTLHWYSIDEILTKGINAPNECYKGKFGGSTLLKTKPGIFVFYVRKNNWNEVPADF